MKPILILPFMFSYVTLTPQVWHLSVPADDATSVDQENLRRELSVMRLAFDNLKC